MVLYYAIIFPTLAVTPTEVLDEENKKVFMLKVECYFVTVVLSALKVTYFSLK